MCLLELGDRQKAKNPEQRKSTLEFQGKKRKKFKIAQIGLEKPEQTRL